MKDVIDAHARREIEKLMEFLLKDITKSNKMWRFQIHINTIHNFTMLMIAITSILSLALSIAALVIATKGAN